MDKTSKKPNIVVILIDDLGVRDLGCTGSTFYETPRLDRMASEGVQFDNAYAASSLCSPARAAILTGRHPVRVDITNFIGGRGMGRMIGPRYRDSLDRKERTVASALRDGGYQTWHVGKWHLGGEGSLPTDHGFDVNIGGHCNGALYHCGYFAPWRIGWGVEGPLPGLEDAPKGQYITDRLTDEAIGLIRKRRADEPFFLHLSHYAVHTPIQSPPELVQKYPAKAARLGLDKAQALIPGEMHPALHAPKTRLERRVIQSHTGYAAMMENLDWNVGRLLDALEAEGIADNTLVVFLSDNGGLGVEPGAPTSNLPYAEGKGWSEDGGLRIPMLMRWPQRIAPQRVSNDVVWQCDLFPTFLAAAGLPSEPDRHVDGVEILGRMEDWKDGRMEDCKNGRLEDWRIGRLEANLGSGSSPSFHSSNLPIFHSSSRPPLCWHYPYYSNQGGGPTGAIRDGDWKLIEWYETGRTALYNLRDDVSESFDCAAAHPEKTAELLARLRAWRTEAGAKMPVVNRWYDDIVAGRIPRPGGGGEFPQDAKVPPELRAL